MHHTKTEYVSEIVPGNGDGSWLGRENSSTINVTNVLSFEEAATILSIITFAPVAIINLSYLNTSLFSTVTVFC